MLLLLNVFLGASRFSDRVCQKSISDPKEIWLGQKVKTDSGRKTDRKINAQSTSRIRR